MYLKKAFIFVFLIIFTSCTNQTLYEATLLEPSSVEVTSNEESLLELINNYRVSIGKNTLTFNLEAYESASEHTIYMIDKGQLSHDNFDSRALSISNKTNAITVSENVAKEYDTNQETIEAWLLSPIHKKNIEGDYSHSAISIKQNTEGDNYITQIFFLTEEK